VVLYLPEDKHIVIDAKVSLKSYTEILKAQSPQEEQEAKKRHIISLKRHIETLAMKQYHKLNELKAPEFTLMFIPIEGAYLMALEIDSSIFEYAYERGVTVVTPTTLMTTLKTVCTLWKLANHDKNMQKLAIEAGSLHDKFALFLEDFNTIEQRLNQATQAWESAKLKLVSGQGNLHSKIKRVGELSSKTKKTLPKS
jgi:DNA recombination protein RmuC